VIEAKTYSVRTVSQAMTAVLHDLVNLNPRPEAKGVFNEILGAQIVLRDPRFSLPYSTSRKFNYSYMLAESIWNLTNTRETEVLRRYNASIDKFVSDQDGDISYAKWSYGTQLNDQVKFCLEELKREPLSRRAAAALYTNADRGPGTPPCLVSVHFQCRPQGSGLGLYQTITMRSNDAWLGLPLDMFQFSLWGHLMAAELGIPFVQYIHHASTLHLYERDLGAAKLWLQGNHGDGMIRTQLDFGSKALSQVLDGSTYGLIKSKTLPRAIHTGAESLVSFMLGDYSTALPALVQIKLDGHGLSWPSPERHAS
jgi:thymidylate synthase